MSASIPTVEPTTLRAGDTWKWRREDLADYPATSWTLKYRFKNVDSGFEVIATADGAYHAITVTAATSAALQAGTYDWQAWVEQGAEKYTVATGRLQVESDLRANTAATPLDSRTGARIALEAVRAVIAKRATRDQEEYAIAGRSLKRTPIADLIKLETHLQTEVAREERAAALAAGKADPRRYYVRFGRV